MDLIYSCTKQLSYHELDFRGLWKPENIFLTMQEAAAAHAEALGAGYDALREKNVCWVLIKASLRMNRYPESISTVRITTWPEPERRMFFPRFFVFEDEKGEQLGSASTLWTLMDIDSRTIVSPAAKGISVDTPEKGPAVIALPGKIKLPEGEIVSNIQEPKYSDLDINGHVNNSRYIDWLTDRIPLELFRTGCIEGLSVSYNKEIRMGETVNLEYSENGGQFRLAGKCGEQTCFTVNADWRKNEPSES